eukprot:9668712-Alexandrium_andersonii.AAC.2
MNQLVVSTPHTSMCTAPAANVTPIPLCSATPFMNATPGLHPPHVQVHCACCQAYFAVPSLVCTPRVWSDHMHMCKSPYGLQAHRHDRHTKHAQQ